jgi:hypothetical protein
MLMVTPTGSMLRAFRGGLDQGALVACSPRLLPIAYCLLPIAYCLLPIAYCLLPIAYCLLPIGAEFHAR